MRLVCAGWKAVHDALVTRLVLTRQTTDEAMGMLVLRFPAVVLVEMKEFSGEGAALTDTGARSVSSLTSLSLYGCTDVTDEGIRAVSSCNTLTSLNLNCCFG